MNSNNHGVKGMKWGVRHDPERSKRLRKRASQIAKASKHPMKNLKNSAKMVRAFSKTEKGKQYVKNGKKIAIAAVATYGTLKLTEVATVAALGAIALKKYR